MLNFEIKKINVSNLPLELFVFFDECKQQQIKNNESLKAMKIGEWNQESWWSTWIGNKIVSVSGCHHFNEYQEHYWRLMLRTATLKEFRAKAPGNIKHMKNDFNWGHILPFQIEHAKKHGAKKMVITTNSDLNGDFNSYRTNHVMCNVLQKRGLVKLIEKDIIIYNVKQNVWEII